MDEIKKVYGKTNGTIYVRVSKKAVGQFGIVARKSGFIEVDTDANADALIAALTSNELAVRFGDLDDQGNYSLTVHATEVAPANTLTTPA
jgi:hypothetical protein